MTLFMEKRNMRVAYALAFISELFFPITAWLFFYLRILDFKQIAVLTAIGALAHVLFEIPTGAFADVVGRKSAIVLSYVLFAITMFALPLATTYGVIIIITLFMSLTNALISGSLESLVYDTLKEQKKEKTFDKVVSRTVALALFGLFIGAVSGGVMYNLWFALPYIVQGIVASVGVVLSLFLVEPKIDSVTYSLSNFLKQNASGFRELFQDLEISQKTFIFTLFGAGYFTAASILGISQAREYGLDAQGVGLVFGAGYLVSALSSHIYPWLRKMLGTIPLFVITCGIVISSFLFAQYVGIYLGMTLIILRITSSTVFTNTSSVIFNSVITSRNRATALSTLALLNKIPYTVGAYFIGEYLDKASPNSLAFNIGMTLICLLVLQWVFFSVVKKIRHA